VFNKIAEFSYKRTTQQAIGFYIAWFLIGLALAFVIGAFLGGIGVAQTQIFMVGQAIALIGAPILTYLVAQGRGVLGSTKSVVLIVLSVIFAYIGGFLLSLPIAAYLTTQE
jgi:hypothetical protein